MAQSTLEFRQVRIDYSDELGNMGLLAAQPDPVTSLLYYPLETEGALTTFRKRVLNYIYRTALGLSDGRVESARVSLSGELDEEDSIHLDLTLTVNAHWEETQVLTQKILDRVSGWSKEWPEEDQQDYGRWIYFGVIPTEL